MAAQHKLSILVVGTILRALNHSVVFWGKECSYNLSHQSFQDLCGTCNYLLYEQLLNLFAMGDVVQLSVSFITLHEFLNIQYKINSS